MAKKLQNLQVTVAVNMPLKHLYCTCEVVTGSWDPRPLHVSVSLTTKSRETVKRIKELKKNEIAVFICLQS